MREVNGAHDADGWKEAMAKEMETLKYHDVYETVPRVKGVRTLKLDWDCVVFLTRTRPEWPPRVTTNAMG